MTWMNCENDGKRNKDLRLQWHTPMVSTAFFAGNSEKQVSVMASVLKKKPKQKPNQKPKQKKLDIPPKSFSARLLLIFHQAEQFDQDQVLIKPFHSPV